MACLEWHHLLHYILASSKSTGTNEFKSHLEELSSLIIENPSNESSMENQKVKT